MQSGLDSTTEMSYSRQKSSGLCLYRLRILQDEEILTKGKLAQLQTYYDKADRIVKVGGRLQNAGLPEETAHPIILPAGNGYVEALILSLSLHRTYIHPGPKTL
jgi:hypothetical protein